jgi:flagellar hook-associated protein 3 FlgL
VSGIQATLDETGEAVILTDQRNEKIILADVEIEGIETSADEMTGYVDFSTIDGNGNSIGSPRRLTDRDLLISNVSADIGQAIDHLSVQKSYVGAQLNKASRQADILAQRKMAVSEDVAKLGEADLAALVTEMQALLINRDAAQQAFAKIGQQSLFDFMR